MALVVPSWFKQRQGKAEEAGDHVYRLTAPNLREAFVRIAPGDDGKWLAAVRLQNSDPDLAASDPVFHQEWEAWEAAFELYREKVVI